MFDSVIQTREREIATEHSLFKLMECVEQKHPGARDFMEASLDPLGDAASDGTKNDEIVRRPLAR